MIFQQIFMMVLTLLIAGFAVIVALKLLVGLLKLVVVGAALGIGAVLALYLIYKMRRLVKGNRDWTRK